VRTFLPAALNYVRYELVAVQPSKFYQHYQAWLPFRHCHCVCLKKGTRNISKNPSLLEATTHKTSISVSPPWRPWSTHHEPLWEGNNAVNIRRCVRPKVSGLSR